LLDLVENTVHPIPGASAEGLGDGDLLAGRLDAVLVEVGRDP
jgi:hypothetical protein